MLKRPTEMPKTHHCGRNCAASEILRLPEVIGPCVGGRLHALLPFRDRRVCRRLYLRMKLGHSVAHITGDARSPSLLEGGDSPRQPKKGAKSGENGKRT
jgi:hypothetical protein